MNERIRELAEQAGFKFIDIRDQFHYNEDSPIKKFAELIVRECIEIAYREGDNVAYLALHFGVEE